MALAPQDRAKLARVLGLLGSPLAGERDAAALAADRLVRGRGLSWLDVLGGEAAAQTPPPSGYLTDLAVCQSRPDLLNEWETEFIADLPRQRNPISPRQKAKVAAIAERIRAAGPRAG